MNKYNILIVDNSFIVRIGLSEIIRERFSYENLSEAASLKETVNLLKKEARIDMVIAGSISEDVEDLIHMVKEKNPETSVLIFSKNMHYPRAMSYLIAGANGFLTQTAEKEEIVKAIEKVLNQGRYLCLELLEAMAEETFINNVHRRKKSPHTDENVRHYALNDKLSKRQKEIVEYIIKGDSLSSIATQLNIKPSTVATHKYIIFEKLGVKTLIELIEIYHGDQVM